MDEAKPFKIPKREVWEAFQRVKANQGAAGVDGQSIAGFEADLKNNLYKLWNRLSSGSYFPPPVRRVDIPKRDGGGVRPLGIPTQTSYCTSRNLSLGRMGYARGRRNPFAQFTVGLVGDCDGVAHPRLSLLR